MNIQKLELNSYIKLPNAGIFNSEDWLAIYDKNLSVFGIFNDNNKLIGTFNIYLQKIKLFNYYRNPHYSPTINLHFETEAKNKSKQLTEKKKVISLISDFIDSLPYHIVSINFPVDFIDFQPFVWKKYKVIPNYTYLIDLTKTATEIESNFSPERRNDIKKAVKDNLICKLTDNYELVKLLVLNTFSRKQKAINESFVNKIFFTFANSTNSFAFVTFANEKPIAASFCIYDKHKTYYLLGGYDNSNKHQGAGALAVWNAIQHAKLLNIPKFDFEGSMLPEVEKYFRGFGGDLTPYYSVNKANFWFEIILKYFKRQIF